MLEPLFSTKNLKQSAPRIAGLVLTLVGVIGIVLSPFVSPSFFVRLWGVEPVAYMSALLLILGLAAFALSYAVPQVMNGKDSADNSADTRQWSQVTQQYFELFDHDLGRPLRRILGKERELRAMLRVAESDVDPAVTELLNEIERQAPNFRLMMSNIRVLVQLEAPEELVHFQPVEPSEVVRRIVDRYTSVAQESRKDITWWSEPSEFGLVYSDSSAIEHIVTNLVDNATRFAAAQVEVRLTRNPTHFFIRVWDDGPGIAAQYQRHIFDRGWTPQVARREEKASSGLGLFIARTLARHYGGELTVESIASPDPEHHTAFLLSLPLRDA